MRLHRLLQAAVVSAALAWSQAAVAEVIGSVTTSPFGLAAPALGTPMLIAAAIALLGLGAYLLRTRAARTTAGLALAVGLGLLATLAYADGTVTVKGSDCNKETTQPYLSSAVQSLINNCPNPIRIVAIEPGCGDPDPPPVHCTVGLVLNADEECILPSCI